MIRCVLVWRKHSKDGKNFFRSVLLLCLPLISQICFDSMGVRSILSVNRINLRFFYYRTDFDIKKHDDIGILYCISIDLLPKTEYHYADRYQFDYIAEHDPAIFSEVNAVNFSIEKGRIECNSKMTF